MLKHFQGKRLFLYNRSGQRKQDSHYGWISKYYVNICMYVDIIIIRTVHTINKNPLPSMIRDTKGTIKNCPTVINRNLKF